MSGLLFLAGVCGFVVIVLWAYKNDGLKADEMGTGFLAMRVPGGEKQKTVPKWKRSSLKRQAPVVADSEKIARKARWRQTFHYGKGR